ncbi:hypothetical protein BGZ97_009438, partial [Linnemannia gamsii]
MSGKQDKIASSNFLPSSAINKFIALRSLAKPPPSNTSPPVSTASTRPSKKLKADSVPFILFLIYYPARKKVSEELDRTTRSKEWTLSLIIAHVVGGHFFIALLITIYLLTFVGGPENAWTSGWASFLGITSVVLATIQYVPQIIRTFRRK